MKYYNLLARNVKTGRVTCLTRYAMSHHECVTMKSKFTENKARTIELQDVTAEIDAIHGMTTDGFKWVYDEKGAHFFQRKTATGYQVMRCLFSDMTNENFQFMAKHGLTNTNKA